jgi:hypothetical protein
MAVLALSMYFDRPKSGVLDSIWSLLSFTLATVSVVLAISSIVYAKAIGGFSYYDPLLLSIYRWGIVLSLGALIFSISALRSRSALRWASLACSIAVMLFWLGSALGE